jgi:hypothetical protein
MLATALALVSPWLDAARKAWTLYHPITVFTGIEDYLPHRSLLNERFL